jgi:hypothetical protein
MFVGLDMVRSDEFRDQERKLLEVEFPSVAEDVAFRFRLRSPEAFDDLLVVDSTIQSFHRSDSDRGKFFEGVVPAQAEIFKPHGETQEVSREVSVTDGMLSEDVFTTNSVAFRDAVTNGGPEGFHIVTRDVVSGVERAGMEVFTIEAGVFTVHLLGHNDFPAFESLGRLDHLVVIGQGARPREMHGSRVFDQRSHNEEG